MECQKPLRAGAKMLAVAKAGHDFPSSLFKLGKSPYEMWIKIPVEKSPLMHKE